MAVNFIIDDALRNIDGDAVEKLVNELFTGLTCLNSNLALFSLSCEARGELCDGVKFRGNLSKVIICCRKFTFFHGSDGHRNLCGLTFVVATKQFRFKGGGFSGSQRLNGLIDTFNEFPRT